MDKSSKYALIILILIIPGYFFLDFICKVGIKCENCARRSNSIEESKKSDFFFAEYAPLEHSIKLKYYDDSIEFSNAWVETQWILNSDNCLLKRKKKLDGYNINVEFKTQTNDHVFNLYGYPGSSLRGRPRSDFTSSELGDTLTFKFVEKHPESSIGWNQKWDGRKIKFVKINEQQTQTRIK